MAWTFSRLKRFAVGLCICYSNSVLVEKLVSGDPKTKPLHFYSFKSKFLALQTAGVAEGRVEIGQNFPAVGKSRFKMVQSALYYA